MKNRIVICFVLLSVLIAGCAYSADEEDNIKANSAAGIEEMEDYIEKDVIKERLAEDTGCIQEGEYYIADVFMQETAFFYPMYNDKIEVNVQCELHIIDVFNGNATLLIRKLPDTKLNNFYEIILTNLQGKCDCHADIHVPDCEYSSDFPIGYFYVDEKNIYMMGYYEEYLEVFMETEVFPPTEEFLEIWNQEQREHYGYFDYRLVCTEEGLEDTYTTQNNYHEFIAVDGDVRKYNLYPEELMGTQEYMYITWDKGISYFATWSGNQKLYKSFWVK